MAFTENSKSLHVSHNEHIKYVHSREWRHLEMQLIIQNFVIS